MNKKLTLMTAFIFFLAVILTACAGMTMKPTADNFKSPAVALESFMVPQYDGFWYYAKAVQPTKGAPDDRGAPLPLSFLFNIKNPNPYPVLLEGIKYTIAFEKQFELITESNQDTYWIPAGTTDQVRITTMITARSALTALLLANAPALKASGMDAWTALEKWWKGVPEFTVPVTIKECTFTFKADGVTKIVPFEATYP